MKKLIAIFLTVVFAQLALAQSSNRVDIVKRDMNNHNVRTEIKESSFVGVIDTSQAYEMYDYGSMQLALQSFDSASISIAYELSVDGTNFTGYAVIDSLVTVSNTGGIRLRDITSLVSGARYARFIFASGSWNEGTEPGTYTATLSRRAYGQATNPQVLLTVVGGATTQDSLDVKLNRSEATTLFGTKVAKADTTTEAGGSYVTPTQLKADSTSRNVLIGQRVAKADTTTEAGGSYVTPTQFKADTTWGASRDAATRALAQDTASTKINRSELAIVFGTATISVGDSVQVPVSGTTATTVAVVSYVLGPTVAYTDSAAGWRWNTADKLTLTGKNGSTISYWLPRK